MADWQIWCPDRGEERGDSAKAWRGYDSPEEAAESWAQQSDWNSAEFEIVKGAKVEVLVAPADNSAKPVRLIVTGEAVPHYTARRVDARLIRERQAQLATAEQRLNERKAGWAT